MEENIDISRFLDEEGKIIKLPRKQTPKRALLEYLAEKFEPDAVYTERQINEICDRWHTFGDYFILRRELVDGGLLARERDGSRYWRIIKSPSEHDSEEAER